MSYYPKTYEIRDNQPSQDFLISHYKSQVLQKTRAAGNFGELQLKFRNLQSELNKASNEKLKLEYELTQLDENSRKRANDLRKQNEDLLNQIKEKEAVNRQLFTDNKILNFEIDKQVTENQKLQEELINQKGYLNSLNYDKNDIEKKLYSLNQIKEQGINDLRNLNDQINSLNMKTNNQRNMLMDKNSENMSILKQIKNERDINNSLHYVYFMYAAYFILTVWRAGDDAFILQGRKPAWGNAVSDLVQ